MRFVRSLGLWLLLMLCCWACSAARTPGSQTSLDSTGPETGSQAVAGVAGAPTPATGLLFPEARPEHAQAKLPVTPADPQWGNVDAPVTIVELSDFQCPFCERVQPTIEALKQKYGPSKLRIVWKHNPLPFHQNARPTHEAAAAVFLLAGTKAFFTFHDLAFANQQDLSQQNVEKWALAAGVSTTALRNSIDSGRAGQKVDEDLALAKSLGAYGTPAFRINGVTLSGAQPLERFVAAVDEQLAAARQLTQTGTPPRLVYLTLTDKNVTLVAPEAAARPEPSEEDTAVWNVPVAADDPQRGAKDALVTLIVFSDFQCPFCKRAAETLSELRRLYGKDLRVVWKDNPLAFHPRALPAAKLARLVWQTKGNDAFWKVHDALFENQSALEDSDLQALAQKQGLNWQALQPALKSDKLTSRIQESADQAGDFQARGTPHFFINGRRLSGAQPLEAFKQLVDEQLAKAKDLAEHSTPRAKVFAALMKDAANPAPPEKKHVDVPAGAASRGELKAPVVIQEFSDFQCPYCKRVEPTLLELEKEFKGSIRIVWRHLPLPFHESAQLAAEAAEEVLEQKGAPAFWQYHDMLYEAQDTEGGLERVSLDFLADKLGLDMARFTAALDQHTHAAKVQADATVASAMGISGTPEFLINDYALSGAQPAAAFRRLIRRALADAKKP